MNKVNLKVSHIRKRLHVFASSADWWHDFVIIIGQVDCTFYSTSFPGLFSAEKRPSSPRRRKALGTRLPFISFYASHYVFTHFRAVLFIIWCYCYCCFFFFAIKAKVEAHNIFLLSWVVKKARKKKRIFRTFFR